MPAFTFKLPGGKKVNVADTPTDTQVLTFNGTDDLWDAQDGGGGGGQTFAKVVKTADETIQSTTTPQDDDELLFTPTINKIYFFTCFLYFDSDNSAGLRVSFSVPTGATCRGLTQKIWRNDAPQNDADMTAVLGFNSDGMTEILSFQGILIMGATAGNFNVQWSQATSQALDCTVFAGSTLLAWEE